MTYAPRMDDDLIGWPKCPRCLVQLNMSKRPQCPVCVVMVTS